MAIFKKNEIVPEKITQNDNSDRYNAVEHWSVTLGNENKYNCNAFVIMLASEDELKLSWQEYRNDIAAYFQADLEIDIEIWNIYIFFVVVEKVSRELKYQIQQDKYSSRKVVISDDSFIKENFYENETFDIEKMLKKCLFNVAIDKSTIGMPNEQSVRELINKIDPCVVDILQNYQPAIKKQRDYYHQYLKRKNIQ